jgi:hypothetical protein
LSDETKPLGPCDESGSGRVHWAVLRSLGLAGDGFGALALADAMALGKGASGSAAALFTGFAVTVAVGFYGLAATAGSGLE